MGCKTYLNVSVPFFLLCGIVPFRGWRERVVVFFARLSVQVICGSCCFLRIVWCSGGRLPIGVRTTLDEAAAAAAAGSFSKVCGWRSAWRLFVGWRWMPVHPKMSSSILLNYHIVGFESSAAGGAHVWWHQCGLFFASPH